MNRQSGIALVTSLFVLVAVMMVGLGSIFLTRTNLRVAENIGSNSMARNNANSGLEAAYLLLANYHDSNGTFPSSADAITLPGGSGFELISYRFDSADQAMVRIKGSTSRGAEHEVEALLSMYQPPPEIPRIYSLGLVSEAEVRVNSNASIYVDVGVHGNEGVEIMGNFYECTARDSSGNCTATAPVSSNYPISMSDPEGKCKIGNAACDPEDYMGEPVDIDPNYYGRRDAAMDLNGDGTFDVTDCLGSLAIPTAIMSNVVVCATGDIKLTNAILTNVTIITDKKIELSGTSTLTNVTLISTEDEVRIDAGTFQGLRIFSDHDVKFEGNAGSYVWNDRNTIASASQIKFNGSGKNSNTVNPIVNPDGSKSVGLTLIAEDDITLNGSSTTNADYYAVFISGDKFIQNGRSTVYGAISSVDDLTFNGTFHLDAGYKLDNDDLIELPDRVVGVLSRR